MYQPRRSGLSCGTSPALVNGASATPALNVHSLGGIEEFLLAQLHPDLHFMGADPVPFCCCEIQQVVGGNLRGQAPGDEQHFAPVEEFIGQAGLLGIAVLEMDEQPTPHGIACKVLRHHALLHVPGVDVGRKAQDSWVMGADKEFATDQEQVIGGVGAVIEAGVAEVDIGNRCVGKMLVKPADGPLEVGLGVLEPTRLVQGAVNPTDGDAGAFESSEPCPGRVECGPVVFRPRRPRAELKDVGDEVAFPPRVCRFGR